MATQRLYKITFLNQGQVYEVYAKRVSQGGLLGFIEVEGLVFGQKTRVVVDPTEERLQREFEGVKRCYLPMHSVDPRGRGREAGAEPHHGGGQGRQRGRVSRALLQARRGSSES